VQLGYEEVKQLAPHLRIQFICQAAQGALQALGQQQFRGPLVIEMLLVVVRSLFPP
jgi:hypothetical protein